MSKLKIFFAYPTNRTQLLKDVKTGKSPDNALYGYNHLSKYFSASFQDIPYFVERILDFLFLPIHLLFISQIDIDFKVPRIVLQLPNINKSEVIVANTDGVGLAVCFLKRLKLIRHKIIYAVGLFFIQGSLETNLKNRKSTWFLRFYKWILSAADHIVYHSPIEKKKLQSLGIYNPGFCTFISMGSDDNFFKNNNKGTSEKDVILSVGKDKARDYRILFKAAEMLPKYKFMVICREKNIANLHIPPNVKTIFEASYEEVTEWYHKSKLLVIPVKEMQRSSGQMTLTDGMQCAKPIIISDVLGISHYKLRNREEVLIVTPGSVQSLVKAIKMLMENRKLRYKLAEGMKSLAQIYTTRGYAKNLSKVIKKLSEPLQLVPLDEKSLGFVRNLRNENREFFLNSNYISKKNHKKWYKNAIKKRNEFNYLLKKNGENIGFGSIYNIDEDKKTADVGRLMIQEKFRGLGYGKLLLRRLEEFAFGELMLAELRLTVLKDNKMAYYLYKKEGYGFGRELIIGGIEAVIMAKTKSDKNV